MRKIKGWLPSEQCTTTLIDVTVAERGWRVVLASDDGESIECVPIAAWGLVQASNVARMSVPMIGGVGLDALEVASMRDDYLGFEHENEDLSFEDALAAWREANVKEGEDK